MTSAERLIEQHVREYESRLKHVDELLTRARSQAASTSEEPTIERELAELTESRDELARHVEQLRHSRSLPDQSEGTGKGGPMGVWDAIASQLEQLIERLER